MQLRQVFWAEIGWYFTIAPNCITGPSKGIPNRLSYGVFPSDKRSPTIFHPGLNATMPQMSLLSLCALLSQQFHLFPICAVLTNNDSRKGLHNIFQVQGNCQCKRLLVSWSAPKTFGSSFLFLEKFWFYTGMVVSTDLSSLVPLQRIDDCFEIIFLHQELCDPLLLNHQNFPLWARLNQCVVSKMPS